MNREALKGWRIGSVAGIPIDIAPSWILVAVLIFWSLGAYVFPMVAPGLSFYAVWPASAIATILFFVSLLGHELSHSLVSLRFGMRVLRIVLFVFGGISETVQEMPSAIAEFWVAIAGPLASLLFAAVFMVLSAAASQLGMPATAIVFSWLGIANAILAVFNLLPGFPLDGGRVLRSILWGATGNYLRATHWGSVAGKGVALLLGVWGLARGFGQGDWFGTIWVGLLGFLLYNAADAAYKQAVMLDALRNVPVRNVMRLDIHPLREDATLPEAVDEVMARYPDQAFPVADPEQHFRGILSTDQVESVPPPFRGRIRVTELMRPIDDGAAIDPDTPATRALERMYATGVDPLPVCDDGRLVGLVGESDLVRYLRWHPELIERAEKS
ncbi:MAG: site-2 protease family protein [Candidatus Sericytochromatia bacterium]|nr:site-2 protease family protein [Candidatus Tanganyikabacteria bacterium]